MDARHFDALAKGLSVPDSRRRLLALLVTLPIVSGLLDIFSPEDAEAKDRRRRRKKRHKKRKSPGGRKKGCRPKSKSMICAVTCGPVKIRQTCGKTVDCGSCACTPTCDICFICRDGPTTPGTCVLDPVQQGKSCGSDGKVCQPDGSCACVPLTECPPGKDCGTFPDGCGGVVNCPLLCANSTPICEDNICVPCERSQQCADGEVCDGGNCEACDVSCATGTCTNAALLTAIAATPSEGTVYICPGRYTGIITLSGDVSLVGAGSGEDENVDTILDALSSGRVINIPANRTIGLHQLHITGGRTTDVNGGAGISHFGTLLTMTDCTVSENHTIAFAGETARGAISNGGVGRLEMTRCTVRNNSADNANTSPSGTAVGGGIYNDSQLVVTDCILRNNTAKSTGGGLYNNAGSSTLTNCRITENTLTSPSGTVAGGIRVNAGSVTLTDSFVWDNTPPDCAAGGGTINGTGCGVEPPA